jgi:xanthine dehydrogenase YagR molybdenum-binding subunit
MLEGNELIGHGMGTATRHANRSAAHALVRILPSGRAFVASGSQELGTGTYTIMADTAAATLSAEERKRVGEYLKASSPSADEAMTALNLK